MNPRSLRDNGRARTSWRCEFRLNCERLEDRRLLTVLPPGYVESVFKDNLPVPPAALTVDQATGDVYFADDFNAEGVLRRIAGDASRTLTTVTTDFTPAPPTAPPPTFTAGTDIQHFTGFVYTIINRSLAGGDFSGELARIDTTTGETTTLENVHGLGQQAGLEIVATKNAIYFTDGNGSANMLYQYDLATGTTSVVTSGLHFHSFSLQLNPADGKLYFARAGEGIFRIDESDGGPALVTQISNIPTTIGNFAIDPLGQHVYLRYFDNIQRLSLETGVVDTFATDLSAGGSPDVAFGPSSNGSGISLYTGHFNSILEYSGFSSTVPEPQPGGIHGAIWQDVNGDGVRDLGEPAQAGVVVYVDADRDGALDASEMQTVTDANGNYFFTDVLPGNHVIREVLPTNFRLTSPQDGRDFYYGWDYSQRTLVKIEPATGNVSTVLADGSVSLHGLAQTNSGELYGINGFNNVLYKINTQTGTITPVGYAGMQLAYGLAYDSQADVLYGLAAPAGADPGEVVLVRFNRASGAVTPVSTTLTGGLLATSGITFDEVNRRVLAFDNNDGEIYEFDIESGAGTRLSYARPRLSVFGVSDDGAGQLALAAGSFLWRINPATGQSAPFLPLSQPLSLDSLELVDFEEHGHRVEIRSGEVVSGFDFGNQSILSSISGTKWNDLNGNGTKDAGEPALANVVVYVDGNNNGKLDAGERQTSTAADGSYVIDGLLPGNYVVREVLPVDYRQTSPGALQDYFWAFDRATDRMVKVDVATGTVTPIGEPGSIGVSADMHGLALTRDGALYAMSGHGNALYQIDTNSGVATPIRGTGVALAWGMAYDAATDTIYGLATPPGFAQGAVQPIIYDRQTGGVTFIGDQVTLNVPGTTGIAFDPVTRRLLAFDVSDRELLAFDVATGVGTSLTTGLPLSAFGMADDGLGNVVLATPTGLAKLNTKTFAVTPLTQPLGNFLLESLEFVNLEPFAHKQYVGPATHVAGLNFGNQSILGELRGIKWEDRDGDGQRDAGEPALPGVVVYLDANNNARLDVGELSQTTDGGGNYAFLDLQPGKYIVREILNQGYEQTSPGLQRDFYWGYDSQMRRIVQVDASSGQVTPIGQQGSIGNGPNIHGLVQTANGELYGISGSDNALYQIDPQSGLATRKGFTGVTLAWALTYDPVTDTIYGAAAPRGTRGPSLQLVTLDRATGAVTYVGTNPTPDVTGTTGMAFDPITQSVLLFDRSSGGRLFSFDPTTGDSTLLRSQLPLFAFGMADDGAGQLTFPINNQLVRLNPETGELFPLAGLSQPVFLEAFEEVDFVPSAHVVYLAPAGSVEGLDFGNRSVVSSLSGVKFNDRNGDGLRQPEEGPLSGVTVYLDLNHDGQHSADEPSTVTNADGAYAFVNLLPGRYIVREIVPAGYAPTAIQSPNDYLIGYDASTRQIVRIDPVTGDVSTLVDMANFPVLDGLVRTNANELFGISGSTNTLFKIDPESGVVTFVGSARRKVAWGLAYDSVTDKIYGLAHPGNDLEVIALAEYDRATGEAIIIGPTVTGLHYTSGLTFDPVRRQVLAYDNSQVRELYAFDPETGAGELLPVALPPASTFGLASDHQGQLIVQANGGVLARLNPDTGDWSFYLQLSRGVSLEGLEFVDFTSNAHDVFILPRTENSGYDIGNQNLAPSNVQFSLSTPVLEGGVATLTGSFADPGSFESHTVVIDWGDGFGQSLDLEPGVKTFTATHTYADNAPAGFTIRINVRDADGGSADAERTVEVGNVAPVASLSGPTSGVRGQSRTFTFTAADVSALDQASAFTYLISWGDGSTPQSITGLDSITVDHVFAASGSFSVQVSVIDKDGGTSPAVSRGISIVAAAMQGNTLVVGGTLGADSIILRPSGPSGVSVTINGVSQGIFQSAAQILVLGQAGDDTLLLDKVKVKSKTTYLTVPATLNGGSGNDTVDARGSTARNALLGGDGADTLYGGSGRDLLIGGLGADVLRGGGNDDILIGGTTDFDTNLAALNSLLAEWARTDLDYQGRIDHLTGAVPGGLNGSELLTPAAVHDDAAVDQLYGEGNQDWFLYQASGMWADNLGDKKKNERTMPT